MNIGMLILGFILALPLAVWQLSTLLSIIDSRGHPAAFLRAALGLVLALAVAVLVSRYFVALFGLAMLLVGGLHLVYFYLFRHMLLGVPVEHQVPLRARVELPGLDPEDMESDTDKG